MAAPNRGSRLRRRGAAAAMAGLAVVLLLVFGTGRYGWINMVRLNRRQSALQREILLNMVHNELLRREIRRMRRDRFYLEAKARENFGMVRPGEVSYRFYSADSLKKKP